MPRAAASTRTSSGRDHAVEGVRRLRRRPKARSRRRAHLCRCPAPPQPADPARGAARGLRRAESSPTTSIAWAGCTLSTRSSARRWPSTVTTTTGSASSFRSTWSGRASCRRERSATFSSMRPNSGFTCTRTARPVDSMVVVVGKPKYPMPMLGGLDPLRLLQSLSVCAARPCRRRIAPYVLKQRPPISQPPGATQVIATGTTTEDHRPDDGRLAGGRRRHDRGVHPPEAGPGECHGRDEVHVPQQTGRVPPRQPAARAAHQGVALFQRRLRPTPGSVAGARLRGQRYAPAPCGHFQFRISGMSSPCWRT